MKISATYSSLMLLFSTSALLLTTAAATPVESDEEQTDNTLVGENQVDLGSPWDSINAAALRKLLLQLETDDRMTRVGRSWGSEPRGWSANGRSLEGRLSRPWHTDKRQVRFRQCYFNPISCFRK